MISTTPLTILIALSHDDRCLKRIQDRYPYADVRTGPWITDTRTALDPDLMKGVNVLLCELPPANFEDFNCLQWIQLTSAGYNQVLDLPVIEKNIRVTNGLGNFDGPIAEWNIMMMLMWQREMLEQLANQKARTWNPDARYQRDVYGSTIGFWGYGGIARETTRLSKAMNLNVWVMTRNGQVRGRPDKYCVAGTGDPEGKLPDRVFGPSEAEAFLGGLDYLFLTTPLTPATEGMIGETQLRMLKPSAVLINPARAAIVQEQAMIRCLQERWIRGASLDVHYAYPLPPDHPLWSMPNVILTPHISGSAQSPYFMERLFDIFTQNLDRFVNGRTMLNELSKAQLQGR